MSREAALAALRERFPEPWRVSVSDFIDSPAHAATASATLGAVQVGASSSVDAMSAVRACIASAAAAGIGELANADRLAEALRAMLADELGEPSKGMPMAQCFDALAAHDARRAKEGA